jgi:CRISPR-associated protein Csd2
MAFISETWKKYIPEDIQQKYEIYDYKHAAAILYTEFPEHFSDVCTVLRNFTISKSDITSRGGNESNIPKKFSDILRPMGWEEKKLHARVIVDDNEISHDTHLVDYMKGRVAFDLEWNSKDQTYDRDLYAFKSFFDYDKLSLGILVTRSTDLNIYFTDLGTYVAEDGTEKKYMAKYGASATQMGKLLPRLEAGRNGGCPILVFGITRKAIVEDISNGYTV